MNPITATLNATPLLELQAILRRGSEPSTFKALAQGIALEVGQQVELILREGTRERRLRQFNVTAINELGDGRVEILGADLRARWAEIPIHSRLNVAAGDGTAFEPATLNGSLPFNAQKALARIFADAAIEPVAVSGVPDAVASNLCFSGTTLARAIDSLLRRVGHSLSVSDTGEVEARQIALGFEGEAARVMESREEKVAGQELTEVYGGPALDLLEIDDGWEAVCAGDGSNEFAASEFFPLADLLGAWGVSERAARQACLSEGGFEALVGKTAPNAGARLSSLKRFAFRAFRAPAAALAKLPWIPVGGLNEDGNFSAPILSCNRAAPPSLAPEDFNSLRFADGGLARESLAYDIDCERGIVELTQPASALEDARGKFNDPTWQDRRLTGSPRMKLNIAAVSARPPFHLSGAAGAPVVHASQLIALYDVQGQIVNAAALRSAAAALQSAAQSGVRRRTTFAGLLAAAAVGSVAEVAISASEAGLTTTVVEYPPPEVELRTERTSPGANNSAVGAAQAAHQPINSYRSGPLIVRAGEGAPETEAYLAVEAAHRDAKTGALELSRLGPLAHAFHTPSNNAALAGRWFFIAGVECVEPGRIRVLADDGKPDARHEALHLEPHVQTRKAWPKGTRGLLVSLGGQPRFVDAGPLISDVRGSTGGAASNLVADLEGDKLSERRQGPLHFLTTLCFSPAHAGEGKGGGDKGWVPALNFRDEKTSANARNGRGLFAERDGKSLGRMTASDQGGPMLADARQCEKHRFGAAPSDDGQYIECSGHLSTESFFKIPGSPRADAPLKFNDAEFAGGVPPWPPYEAEIKYDSESRHTWNGAQREGLWRIQYRVPFSNTVPPTWTPPVKRPPPPVDDPPEEPLPTAMAYVPAPSIQPIVGENEIWAPSHDWIPAPSEGATEAAIVFPGPALKSAGFAAEEGGVPNVSLGGGAIVLPPLRGVSQAQQDSGARQSFFALHPEVVLAFGFPRFAGAGAGKVVSGWHLSQNASADLELLPVDANAAAIADKSHGMRVAGFMKVGPAGAVFATDESAGALRLAMGEGDGIAFGEDVKLYSVSPGVLRTDAALHAASASVDGKLTVGGLIDPTGMQFSRQPANPGTADTVWVDNGSVSGHTGRAKFGSERLAFVSEIPAAGLADPGANGVVVRTAANATVNRSIAVQGAGSQAGLAVAAGDGVSGNPTLGMDINGTASSSEAAAINDEWLGYNNNVQANQSFTTQQLLDGIGGLSTVAPNSLSHSLPYYSTAAKLSTIQQFLDTFNLLSGATPLLTSKLAGYLASASAARSFTPQDVYDLINSLDLLTAGGGGTETPATGDKLAVYNASDSRTEGVTLENFFKVIGNLPQKTSVTDGFKFLVQDESGAPGFATFEDLDPQGVHLICRTVAYTGSGSSGKQVTLTGINRAYQIQIIRYDTTGTNSPVFSIPEGATGNITWRSGDGGSGTSLSLGTEAGGQSQVLTINSTASGLNANGVAYKIAVWGTPT